MRLLVFGLAAITAEPVLAKGGYHWDATCNCRRPDSQYTTRRYVRGAPKVRTHERYVDVDHTRVVRGHTRLIQENREYVHVKPIIDREVVAHRTNTIVRDTLLHRVHPIYREKREFRHEVVNRYEPGWVRHVLERREVRDCGCGQRRGLFQNHGGYSESYGLYSHHGRGLFQSFINGGGEDDGRVVAYSD